MATKVGIGVSSKKDSFQAGKTAARDAFKQLKGQKPDFGFVFSCDVFDQQELLNGINSVLNCSLMGGNSAGIITEKGLKRDSVGIMLIKSDKLIFVADVVIGIKTKGKRAGVELAKKLRTKLKRRNIGKAYNKVAVLMPDGFSGNLEKVVEGFRATSDKDMLLTGGASGDNLKFFKTFQFLDGKAYSDAVVGLVIASHTPIGTALRHGWEPVEEIMTITKSKGNVVYEINHKPAFEVYKEKFGEEFSLSERNFPKFAMLHPLGIKEKDGTYTIRDPLQANKDGSITCVSNVPQRSKIRIMYGNDEAIIRHAGEAAQLARQELGGGRSAGLIIFDCISRLLLLGEKAKEEVALMKKNVSGVPLLGIFTFGEIGGINPKSPRFCNKSATLLVLPK